jgi:dGTPase
MAGFGGFDHNEQTFRILTALERRYAGFDGLNLTWEALEGVVKHNGPLVGPGAKAKARPVPPSIATYSSACRDLELEGGPGLEAQVAALADDIAYNNPDIDDGLYSRMFDVDQILAVALFREAHDAALASGIDDERVLRHQVVRRIINRCTQELLESTRRQLQEARVGSVEEVRQAGRRLVSYSPEMSAQVKELKEFLLRNMYRHYRVVRMGDKAGRILRDLFHSYVGEPRQLPPRFQQQMERDGVHRVVCDYIAGMTDRFAVDEHQKLFDPLVRV